VLEDQVVIKILGSGCKNCQKLEQISREAVADLGIDAAVEHVTDLRTVMSYGVLSTPGLVINEKVVSSGRVPSKDEVKKYIRSAEGN
jgi:small redox-active disulfide protein 2